jgi:hypothetical protein
VWSRAETEEQARRLVQNFKTPNEVSAKLEAFHAKQRKNSAQSGDKHAILGRLISTLLDQFPNALPETFLIEHAEKEAIEKEFIEKILDQLQNAGLLLRNTDFRGNHVLKFLNLPIKQGKLEIRLPHNP